MNKISQAILKTLAYADIFDFPLTIPEIGKYILSERKVDYKALCEHLQKLEKGKLVNRDGKYFFLKGRQKTIILRWDRGQWTGQKMKIANQAARWLKLMPTIKMVAITGALAMGNSAEDDDIDLLIVSSHNHLWLTRLLTIPMVELMGKRRKPLDVDVENKICLNMFVDESSLEIPRNEQNLYSAHEVVQMKPLWEKDQTYRKFLWQNQWIEKYLPNAINFQKPKTKEIKKTRQNLCEWLSYSMQISYMKKRRTTEIVKPYFIRFHPHDCKKWVLLEYKKRLERLGIGI